MFQRSTQPEQERRELSQLESNKKKLQSQFDGTGSWNKSMQVDKLSTLQNQNLRTNFRRSMGGQTDSKVGSQVHASYKMP